MIAYLIYKRIYVLINYLLDFYNRYVCILVSTIRNSSPMPGLGNGRNRASDWSAT